MCIRHSQKTIDARYQLSAGEGLRDVIFGSQFVAFFYIFVMHLCRQQDYRNRCSSRFPFEPYKHLQAVHLRHHDVENNEVRLTPLNLIEVDLNSRWN